jgi:enamine deaminase RidA (YjgF/YER057c/UK114 family)
MSTIDAKLAELGLTLPEAAAPVAAYVPVVVAGGLAHVSGQLPFIDGALVKGRLGEDVSIEDGYAAARACGLMLLAQLKAALGSLDKVERIVKLGVFINSTGAFTAQPQVANGASELMAAVFGDAGKHARSAVGVPVLPWARRWKWMPSWPSVPDDPIPRADPKGAGPQVERHATPDRPHRHRHLDPARRGMGRPDRWRQSFRLPRLPVCDGGIGQCGSAG